MNVVQFVQPTNELLKILCKRAYPKFGSDDPSKAICATASPLAAVINEVVKASLMPEEGKRFKFSLLIGRASWSGKFDEKQQAPFARLVPFSAATLSKLAPLCLRQALGLVITISRTGETVVSGLSFMPSPCILEIEVTGPGKLIFFTMGQPNFTYSIERGLVPLTCWKTLYGYMWAAVDRIVMDDAQSRPVGEILERTVQIASEYRNGGTILVVPKGDKKWTSLIDVKAAKLFAPPITRVSDALSYMSTLTSLRRGGRAEKNDVRVGEDFEGDRWVDEEAFGIVAERIREHSKFLAPLSAIDGALVVDTALSVFCCGAKITLPRTKPQGSVVVGNPLQKIQKAKVTFDSLGGTRHTSAAGFVARHKKAFAVVLSQDGRLSLFAWDDKRNVLVQKKLDDLLR